MRCPFVVRERGREEMGPWAAPAGERSRSAIVVAPDQTFDNATANALEDAKVNPIIPLTSGAMLYGWRSLSSDTRNWRLLTGIDVINRIVVAAQEDLKPMLFSTIDAKGHLLSRIEGALTAIVEPMAKAGGLYPWIEPDSSGQPVQLDPGYQVSTDPSREVASGNMVKAMVAVRVSPTAVLVALTITKVGVTRRF